MEAHTVPVSKLGMIRRRLSKVLDELRSKTDELERLVEIGADSASIHEVESDLQRLGTARAGLLADLRLASFASEAEDFTGSKRMRGRPLRESILDALDELGQPASPSLLSDLVHARFGVLLPAGRLASIRRDELMSYRKDPTGRPAWVVPAISIRGFTAMPRLLTASSWKLEQRTVGTRTLRVIHLKTQIALVEMHARLRPSDEATASRVMMLILRLAEGFSRSALAKAPDLDAIRATAQAELVHVEPADQEERIASAARLSKLQEPLRFWGRPALIDGLKDATRSIR
jgi:hypothetical protein